MNPDVILFIRLAYDIFSRSKKCTIISFNIVHRIALELKLIVRDTDAKILVLKIISNGNLLSFCLERLIV